MVLEHDVAILLRKLASAWIYVVKRSHYGVSTAAWWPHGNAVAVPGSARVCPGPCPGLPGSVLGLALARVGRRLVPGSTGSARDAPRDVQSIPGLPVSAPSLPGMLRGMFGGMSGASRVCLGLPGMLGGMSGGMSEGMHQGMSRGMIRQMLQLRFLQAGI